MKHSRLSVSNVSRETFERSAPQTRVFHVKHSECKRERLSTIRQLFHVKHLIPSYSQIVSRETIDARAMAIAFVERKMAMNRWQKAQLKGDRMFHVKHSDMKKPASFDAGLQTKQGFGR